ncbi:rhodanese-like domain-containing protein [Candidatus Gracilibacteria bacterium]|nr:rhodanese-like domain-containing protein [Candidatus Gracilibacteria bacterium]
MPNYETLSPEAFKAEIALSDTTLIDIRTTGEQDTFGVISDNQIHIDITLANTQEKLEALSKTGRYLIYCWHGTRSKHVMKYMDSVGFEYVKDLDGGIDKWKS